MKLNAKDIANIKKYNQHAIDIVGKALDVEMTKFVATPTPASDMSAFVEEHRDEVALLLRGQAIATLMQLRKAIQDTTTDLEEEQRIMGRVQL